MGGIWVDYELQTSIKGLFAIGECSFSDHGAKPHRRVSSHAGSRRRLFRDSYTMQNYLSDQIKVPHFTTDAKEFDEAEKAVRARIEKFMNIMNKVA